MKRLKTSLSAPIDLAHGLIGNANCARSGRSFAASALLAAAAILPCIILVRAERAARAAHPETTEPASDAALEAVAA